MKNSPTSYYSYISQYQTKDGKIVKNIEKEIDIKYNKGYYVEKKDGKVIKKDTINDKNIENYRKSNHNIILSDDLLAIAHSMYKSFFNEKPSVIKDDKTDKASEEKNKPKIKDKKPSDLSPGSKTKTSRETEAKKLSYKENSICKEIIKEFGLDPSTATKKDIEKIYNKLYKDLEKKCTDKKDCKDKETLMKRYNTYFNPEHKCI